MEQLRFLKRCFVITPVTIAVLAAALVMGSPAALAKDKNADAALLSSKASDSAFAVPTVRNPIQDRDVEDAAIAEEGTRWLVNGKVLAKYGIQEVSGKPGVYQLRLPEAAPGVDVPWQNKNVELQLPGIEGKKGYMVSIRNIRRPLGISYVLHASDKKELLLPTTPVQAIPELKPQKQPQFGNKKAKTGTVILWDPKMEDNDTAPQLKARRPVISPCAFSISKQGLVLKHPDFDTYVQKYHDRGYDVWPLVDNAFDPKLTHEVLTNKRLQEQIIGELIGYAGLYGFSGYNLDFENVNYPDQEKLTTFVNTVAERSKAYGLATSMDITVHSDSPNWSRVYDRLALGKSLDYVVLMAYDEYSRQSPKAGPTASYPWVENGVRLLSLEVDSSKIILGMPLYMRTWYEDNSKAKLPEKLDDWKVKSSSKLVPDKFKYLSMRTLSMADSKEYFKRFDSYINWDDTLKLNYMSLPLTAGRVKVWFEDEKSLQQKMNLYRKYKLGGIAFWRKDFEDESFWKTFGKHELT